MIEVLIAIGSLCNFNYANNAEMANAQCQKYYAECMGDLTKISVGGSQVPAAEKLRQCILKNRG